MLLPLVKILLLIFFPHKLPPNQDMHYTHACKMYDLPDHCTEEFIYYMLDWYNTYLTDVQSSAKVLFNVFKVRVYGY